VCGRFVSSQRRSNLLGEYRIDPERADPEIPASYNVAPTDPVYAVVERLVEGEPVRQLRVMRWGLVPSWAKDPSGGSRMINAQVETAAEKPAFRKALVARRCVLPAEGFYEWTPRKEPYFIHPTESGALALAGLYEFWRDPERPPNDPDAWLVTCTILTRDALGGLEQIHGRMPVAVDADHVDAWLDPALTRPAEVQELVRSILAHPVSCEAYRVSRAVNTVANNRPDLVEQVVDEPDGLF
jgi:putative SOS response-associated peptidase YedK